MALRYVSTRGAAPALGFADALLTGLAPDGGLYVPEAWPQLDLASAGANYVETAIEVMWPFVEGALARDDFERLVTDAYSTFVADDVVDLHDLGGGHYLLDLFHGPTLAFKDIALQLVGRLFDHELTRRDERVTIVGATSGDTGSAAIEACRDRDAIDIFILFPHGRVSDVQRRQMTSVESSNVHNIAIDGTFDDCQDMVKAMFNDEPFRKAIRISAVNSINWARVMAQIVYYVVAAERLGGRSQRLSFAVPTGNFGNVYAGWGARSMGLPIDRLIVASNRNDILTRFFTTGEMEIRSVIPTLSPSMDIQVSSNLERLLFEIHGRDGQRVAEMLTEFRETGTLKIDPEYRALLGEVWSGGCLPDEGDGGTSSVIAEVHDTKHMVVDPHTAVGVGVARTASTADTPIVSLATAHPAKFPDAVESAIGIRPDLPARVADLFEREERFDVLPNDLAAVQAHILERTRVTHHAP